MFWKSGGHVDLGASGGIGESPRGDSPQAKNCITTHCMRTSVVILLATGKDFWSFCSPQAKNFGR